MQDKALRGTKPLYQHSQGNSQGRGTLAKVKLVLCSRLWGIHPQMQKQRPMQVRQKRQHKKPLSVRMQTHVKLIVQKHKHYLRRKDLVLLLKIQQRLQGKVGPTLKLTLTQHHTLIHVRLLLRKLKPSLMGWVMTQQQSRLLSLQVKARLHLKLIKVQQLVHLQTHVWLQRPKLEPHLKPKATHLLMQKLRNMLRKVPVQTHKQMPNPILRALLIHELQQKLKYVQCLMHKVTRPLTQKFQRVLHKVTTRMKAIWVPQLLVTQTHDRLQKQKRVNSLQTKVTHLVMPKYKHIWAKAVTDLRLGKIVRWVHMQTHDKLLKQRLDSSLLTKVTHLVTLKYRHTWVKAAKTLLVIKVPQLALTQTHAR